MATAQFPREAVPQPNSSETILTLRRSLDSLAARRNTQQMAICVARAAVVGVGLAALLMLAHRFYLVDAPWWSPVVLVVAALLIGVRNGAVARAGAFDAALDADRVLGLDERLSSALAFAQPELVRRAQRHPYGSDPMARIRSVLFPRVTYRTAHVGAATPLVPALVEDAAARARGLDPKRVYPISFDRTAKALAAVTVAFVAFSLMPNIDWMRSPEQRALAGVLNRQGKELEAVAKQVREKKEIEEQAEAKRMAKKLEALGKRMQRGRMSKKEALLSMGQLRQELEKAADSKQQNSGGVGNLEQIEQQLQKEAMQSMEGQQMQRELEKKQYEKAAEQLDKLADKIESGKMTQQEKEQAANDLEKAAKALREAGNEDAARTLEDAAKNLRAQEQQNGQQGQQKKQGQGQQQKQGQNGQESPQGGQQQQKQQGQKQGQQQGAQGGQGQQQSPKSGEQSGSGAGGLRNLAKQLRSSGSMGNSQAMRDMMNKIAQAERDTGQNNGQPKQGRVKAGGECKGGNCNGQMVTPGKDLKVSDPHGQVGGGAGLGPRNNAQGVRKGGGVSSLRTRRSGDNRRWEDVWSDRLPKTQKKMDRITGKMGDSGEVEQLPTRTEAEGGPVRTPYYDVYESYKKDAEDAVSKEVVPPAYKQPVKEYFDSLKPGQ
ncbi:MAG TPA: hypothetical protein VF600_13775 [Abditibacteriaceae bacterium]|jgi:hypothetical protein